MQRAVLAVDISFWGASHGQGIQTSSSCRMHCDFDTGYEHNQPCTEPPFMTAISSLLARLVASIAIGMCMKCDGCVGPLHHHLLSATLQDPHSGSRVQRAEGEASKSARLPAESRLHSLSARASLILQEGCSAPCILITAAQTPAQDSSSHKSSPNGMSERNLWGRRVIFIVFEQLCTQANNWHAAQESQLAHSASQLQGQTGSQQLDALIGAPLESQEGAEGLPAATSCPIPNERCSICFLSPRSTRLPLPSISNPREGFGFSLQPRRASLESNPFLSCRSPPLQEHFHPGAHSHCLSLLISSLKPLGKAQE